MVLDVYVMPLWRYLAREDEWERGTFAADPANRALSVSPAEARSFVARLRHGFRDVSRNAMRWHDKGATVSGKKLTAGDNITEGLRESDVFDWREVSAAEAREGVGPLRRGEGAGE